MLPLAPHVFRMQHLAPTEGGEKGMGGENQLLAHISFFFHLPSKRKKQSENPILGSLW